MKGFATVWDRGVTISKRKQSGNKFLKFNWCKSCQMSFGKRGITDQTKFRSGAKSNVDGVWMATRLRPPKYPASCLVQEQQQSVAITCFHIAHRVIFEVKFRPLHFCSKKFKKHFFKLIYTLKHVTINYTLLLFYTTAFSQHHTLLYTHTHTHTHTHSSSQSAQYNRGSRHCTFVCVIADVTFEQYYPALNFSL